MGWMETRNDTTAAYGLVLEKFKARFEVCGAVSEDEPLFKHDCGVKFSIHKMGDEDPWNFVVIDYDGGEDADTFYPNEYDSLDELFNAIVQSIDNDMRRRASRRA